MTLLRSGDNLHSGVVEFINQSEHVEVFSPFIKVDLLEQILGNTPCVQIVVRWQLGDILQEVCDFEKLYDFCKNRNIALYRNTRMHLKVLVNERKQILFGSANVTNRGMGLENFNFELSGHAKQIDFEDEMYLTQIVDQSEYISDDVYHDIFERVQTLRKEYIKPPIIPDEKFSSDINKGFLMTSLPMSWSPLLLWLIYSDSDRSNFTQEEVSCAVHDITLYKIPENLDEALFIAHLSNSFNDHLFIRSLKSAIIDEDRNSMGYSMVANWLSENTETVPTPRRWEIKDLRFVNILQNWICQFDSRFKVDRPNGGSSWLIYEEELQSNLPRTALDITIQELLNIHVDGRNEAPAPHKFIALLAILKTIEEKNIKDNKIEINLELDGLFKEIWKKYDRATDGRDPNLSMPLKSLFRDTIIDLQGVDCQDRKPTDYRSINALMESCNELYIRKDFWWHFSHQDSRTRIRQAILKLLERRYG